MFQRDTIGGTFAIAAVLCVVCSVVVSATAVGLRPIKNKNEKIVKIIAQSNKLPS